MVVDHSIFYLLEWTVAMKNLNPQILPSKVGNPKTHPPCKDVLQDCAPAQELDLFGHQRRSLELMECRKWRDTAIVQESYEAWGLGFRDITLRIESQMENGNLWKPKVPLKGYMGMYRSYVRCRDTGARNGT